MQIHLLCLMLAFFISGCMKPSHPTLQTPAQIATESIGCESQESKVFDSVYTYLELENQTADISALKHLIADKIDHLTLTQKINKSALVEDFKNEYSKIFDLLLIESKNLKTNLSATTLIQKLIELEMQDQSSSENIRFNSKLDQQFKKVKNLRRELQLSCHETRAKVASTRSTGMVVGMNNVIAIAYQSCNALNVPPVNASTPRVLGIKRITPDNPDGIGWRRIVSDLKAVQQTHPYNKVAGSTTSSSCFNVYNNPLIYDYGGEPFFSNNALNFFKNAGTGTSVLGVDCSSLVSSAAAAGGLRYRPGMENKAVFVRQSSYKFMDPASSGFTCYKNISVSKQESLKAGDIAAVSGHILTIDRIGADPFGIKRLTSISGCSSLSTKFFDFTIAQSSSSKNGLGIHKYVAKDYLNEVDPATEGSVRKMKNLFLSVGQAACKAYFQNTSSTPKSSEWGLIRHKGSSECLAPQMQIAGQSCVRSCLQ
ncbi:MAG: hypothetical protein H7235_07160 [Bdellovibrionaceae bacterium]|nr:hypothetical protein [Pseudobdellovibrionaceae bacterium]